MVGLIPSSALKKSYGCVRRSDACRGSVCVRLLTKTSLNRQTLSKAVVALTLYNRRSTILGRPLPIPKMNRPGSRWSLRTLNSLARKQFETNHLFDSAAVRCWERALS
jgi:hypothetical protein